MPKQIFYTFVDSAEAPTNVVTSCPACSVLAWPALPCLAARHAPSWLCYDLSSVNVAARLTARLPTYLPAPWLQKDTLVVPKVIRRIFGFCITVAID